MNNSSIADNNPEETKGGPSRSLKKRPVRMTHDEEVSFVQE